MEAELVFVRRDTALLRCRTRTMNTIPNLSSSEIIAMAWADEISFDRIKRETGLAEGDVIRLMRGQLKPRSFALWRARVSGRKAKHERKNRLRVVPDAGDL
jgi:uncharacterized protein (TIGR03643 family)